jgi:hypothetical protein
MTPILNYSPKLQLDGSPVLQSRKSLMLEFLFRNLWLESPFYRVMPTTLAGYLKLTLELGASKLTLTLDGTLALDIGNTLLTRLEKPSEMLQKIC